MMYGLNFGHSHVTECPVKFPMRKRFPEMDLPRGHAALLVGVTNKRSELNLMLMTANNGHRLLQTHTKKGCGWVAIYAY